MVDGRIAQDLAEVVLDHLDRGPQTDLAVGTIANGLSRISSALHDIQERDGNWSNILRKLHTGIEEVQISLDVLRVHGSGGVAGLLAFAERQLLFAELLEEELLRRRTLVAR